MLDLARHLVGEIKEVCADSETFIKQRPLPDRPRKKGRVTVDDMTSALLRFQNGARGTLEVTRFATGRANDNRFEINGSKGSIVFNLERMNELEYFDNTADEDRRGFSLIQTTEAHHPYAGNYWPVGHITGYEHTFVNLIADALRSIDDGTEISPNFVDGYENQRVLDAVERSHAARGWVKLQGS